MAAFAYRNVLSGALGASLQRAYNSIYDENLGGYVYDDLLGGDSIVDEGFDLPTFPTPDFGLMLNGVPITYFGNILTYANATPGVYLGDLSLSIDIDTRPTLGDLSLSIDPVAVNPKIITNGQWNTAATWDVTWPWASSPSSSITLNTLTLSKDN